MDLITLPVGSVLKIDYDMDNMIQVKYLRWTITLLPVVLWADIFLTVFRGVDFVRYASCAGETGPCVPGVAFVAVFFWFAIAGLTFWLWRLWNRYKAKIKLWKGVVISVYAYLLFQLALLLFLDNVTYLLGMDSPTLVIGRTVGIGISAVCLLFALLTSIAIYMEGRIKTKI